MTNMEEFRSSSLCMVMFFNFSLSLILTGFSVWKQWKHGGLYYLNVAMSGGLFLIKDVWYFSLYFTHQLPSTSFHYARVFIPLIASGLLACLGIERFRAFSKAGLAPWYPFALRMFMIGLTLTMLSMAIGLLLYGYSNFHLKKDQQRSWTKGICSFTMLYFLVIDLTLSILSFVLILRFRFHWYPSLAYYHLPPFPFTPNNTHKTTTLSFPLSDSYLVSQPKHTFKQKRSIKQTVTYCIGLLTFMVVSSSTAFILFYFSKSILWDMLTLLFVRLYIIAAFLEWHYTIGIVTLQ